jgi:hypothetical protein
MKIAKSVHYLSYKFHSTSSLVLPFFSGSFVAGRLRQANYKF